MEPTWTAALDSVDALSRAVQSAGVLRGAARAGLLAELRRPRRADELAVGTGVGEARVHAVLEVLGCLEVAAETDGRWALTPAWAAALEGGSPLEVVTQLEAAQVRARRLEHSLAADQPTYWELDPDDRLTAARGASFDPTSAAVAQVLRRPLAQLDGIVSTLEAGGRVLELGCGIGSRLTALALAFPAVHGTGVELEADLAEYGRRRAASLGVADRVSYVVGDALTFDGAGSFDLVTWSQFFFPSPTRAGALASAWRALRPGGWVTAPVIWAPGSPPADAALRTDLALEGVYLDLDGIPAATTAHVGEEMRAAGFAEVRTDDLGFVHAVSGRRPTDPAPSATPDGDAGA